MKKLLSIVLVTALLLGSLSVAASARVYDYEISLGETLTVRVGSETTRSVKFVPEYDTKFILTAESDGLYTYADLWDSETDEWCESGNYFNSEDFCLQYKFEKGKIYYFEIGVFGNGEDETDVYEFKITLSCGHSFDGDTCTVCSYVCEHDTPDFLGCCPCGEAFLGTDLTAGFETEYDKTKNSMWFRFVPEETGLYLLESASADELSDLESDLYNADGEWLYNDTDSVGMDFRLYYILEAGETYYYNVYPYFCEPYADIKFNRVTHTTDDGVEHTDLAFEETIWSNCTEHGYAEGVYCNTCEEFISGHEELELDKEWHIDDDGDDVCDLCGDDFGCKHICHSDNWFLKIIWAIINFFNSLYDMGMECECGYLHW